MKESKYDDFFLFGVVSKYVFMDLPVLIIVLSSWEVTCTCTFKSMKIKYSCFLTTFSCVLPYIWERKKSGQIMIKNISAIKEKNVYMSKYHWEYMYQLNDILRECNVYLVCMYQLLESNNQLCSINCFPWKYWRIILVLIWYGYTLFFLL